MDRENYIRERLSNFILDDHKITVKTGILKVILQRMYVKCE